MGDGGGKLCRLLRGLGQAHKENLTGPLQFELRELENVFTLLVLGQGAGLPLPPPAASLDLLPLLERDLVQLMAASHDAKDMLATLAARFDGF